jgi:hypothetical protein
MSLAKKWLPNPKMNTGTIFLTIADSNQQPAVRLLIDSLRAFGGELADAPVWVFTSNPASAREIENGNTHLIPLLLSERLAVYPFGNKVAACARAEELAPTGTRSLVWIDPSILVVQPPALFKLGANFDAAFRPVHIRNVGLSPTEHLDAFWQGIYAAVSVEDIASTVKSFVDSQLLRIYFNTHAFSINPTLGLMQRWHELFQQLVGDTSFQCTACVDISHRIFLFQALLSALVATLIVPERIRLLPETYNYPFHLQNQIPVPRRLLALNETVCFAYEELSIHPNKVTGIEVREPLRAWLESRVPKYIQEKP